MKKQTDSDDMLRSINYSIAEQVQRELDNPKNYTAATSSPAKKRKRKRRKKKKKRVPALLKFLFSLLLIIACLGAFLVLTPAGRKVLIHFATEYAYSKLEYAGTTPEKGDPPLTTNIDLNSMSSTFVNAAHDEDVINLLLLGVEAIGYAESGGHTDAIMIATLNKKTNELKLTSLMRDTWVEIPGYGANRINIAYAKGGVKLVYETIALNYDIRLDGYALVGFDAFEKVIDRLGGVTITLTEEEANYLNHTNYISKKKYRNVVAGTQTLNGNQALGYCRVRKVATLDGSNYDMGRTSRQRRVINAAFDKFKTSGITELVGLMNDIIPLVQTDINKNNCKHYLSSAIEIGLKDMSLENLRLPADNEYSSQRINGNAVLVPDWEVTKKTLSDFIFGVKTEQIETTTGE